MITAILTFTSIATGAAVLWLATFAIISDTVIRPYLPVVLLAIAYPILGTVYFYGLINTSWHVLFTLLYFGAFAWLAVEFIIRVTKDDK